MWLTNKGKTDKSDHMTFKSYPSLTTFQGCEELWFEKIEV
jgi:hypothetical protein